MAKSSNKSSKKSSGKSSGDKRAASAEKNLKLKSRRDSDISSLVFVAKSKLHGLGMFAAVDIPAGEQIGELVGRPTHDDGIYVLWITDELGLEVQNDLKYINHGRPANCELTDVDVVTLTDIKAGEELLHDYGW